MQALDMQSRESNGAAAAVVDRIQWVAERLGEDGAPYAVLWRDVAGGAELALDVMQMVSLIAMVHKHCFPSAARLALASALVPLQKALQSQVSTMWWMFDIGQ